MIPIVYAQQVAITVTHPIIVIMKFQLVLHVVIQVMQSIYQLNIYLNQKIFINLIQLIVYQY